MAVFFPIVFPITSIVDRFVAGPTINTTNPAAGFIPFAIRDATNGTEPVEQMYIDVAGVAIRKASVDGLDAPCSYKLRPVGMTPHEHRGNGISKIFE
jgi:hypothetical protein